MRANTEKQKYYQESLKHARYSAKKRSYDEQPSEEEDSDK